MFSLTRSSTSCFLSGAQWHQGIPIEVVPFAYAPVLLKLASLGSPTRPDAAIAGGNTLALRMGKAKAGPVVSDNGNFIVDAPFGREEMSRPREVRVRRVGEDEWRRRAPDAPRSHRSCCRRSR